MGENQNDNVKCKVFSFCHSRESGNLGDSGKN
jgi:hypothetical protein